MVVIMAIKYPRITVRIVGHNGNAISVMSRVKTALKQHGVSPLECTQFQTAALSGTYEQLLATCAEWVNLE